MVFILIQIFANRLNTVVKRFLIWFVFVRGSFLAVVLSFLKRELDFANVLDRLAGTTNVSVHQILVCSISQSDWKDLLFYLKNNLIIKKVVG